MALLIATVSSVLPSPTLCQIVPIAVFPRHDLTDSTIVLDIAKDVITCVAVTVWYGALAFYVLKPVARSSLSLF